MPSIRRATIADLPSLQSCNLMCLPQNYHFQYYLYHYLSWPELIHIAEDGGSVCGYVLAKMDDQNSSEGSQANKQAHGHITSLSTLRTHRRLGLSNALLPLAHDAMVKTQSCKYVQLHVRVSNRAALGLYRDKMGYSVNKRSEGYYADGEDAFEMRKYLVAVGAGGGGG